ncbi:hypothetical protein SAMN05421720_11917 [Rhodospira trueperi]|uniref:Uncharacterized protein n=1 Tax=Rhodospira trueperi TaxID=69960 RepID=A0A1G7HA44_9PROT|nr:hypothetical protein SAMN05421720_11917 [Rhodospira trueperi]
MDEQGRRRVVVHKPGKTHRGVTGATAAGPWNTEFLTECIPRAVRDPWRPGRYATGGIDMLV